MIARLIQAARLEYHGAHLRLIDVEARVRPLTSARRRKLQRRLAHHLNTLTRLGVQP